MKATSRALPCALAFLAAWATVAGCGGARPHYAPHAHVVPARCPARVPKRPTAHPRPGSDDAMVPTEAGRPVASTVCRYRGMNDRGMNDRRALGTLARRRSLTRRADVRALAAALNDGHKVTRGTYNCPMDEASSDLVIFEYSAGPRQQVKVKLTGCAWAMNGRLSLWPTARASKTLARLVGEPSRHAVN